MSSGLVRCAFDSLMEGDDHAVDSSRIISARAFGRHILQKTFENEMAMAVFDAFCDELTACLRGIVEPNATYRSCAAKREKLWIAFHQIRISTIPKIWEKFLSSQGISQVDHFFLQSVTQKLFEMLLLREFSVAVAADMSNSSSAFGRKDDLSLSEDELSVLRYACGYVPHHLLKKFQKKSGKKYNEYNQCLGQMAVSSDSDEDFLAYTKYWINKVNRGGLFQLNNSTFRFFVCIEKEVQLLLPKHMAKSDGDSAVFKESIVKRIMHSEDVGWNWTLLSQCIDEESDAIELLQEIVTLWVTVRGYAITATWMETYKAATKNAITKNPGFRKGLSKRK